MRGQMAAHRRREDGHTPVCDSRTEVGSGGEANLGSGNQQTVVLELPLFKLPLER